MADAADSKSVARKGVGVQVPPSVLTSLGNPACEFLHRFRSRPTLPATLINNNPLCK